MNKYAVGNNIYNILKERKLSQKWLAIQIGVHETAVSKWTCGQTQMKAVTLYRISKVLGVTMESLMEGVEDGGED